MIKANHISKKAHDIDFERGAVSKKDYMGMSRDRNNRYHRIWLKNRKEGDQ
jgi:hypothetical protein